MGKRRCGEGGGRVGGIEDFVGELILREGIGMFTVCCRGLYR